MHSTWRRRPGRVPDLNVALRCQKQGFGINSEQALSDDVGLFARGSWADGKTEIYAFTEIDRSLSAGLLIQGRKWGRANDTLGIGVARNFLSSTVGIWQRAGWGRSLVTGV